MKNKILAITFREGFLERIKSYQKENGFVSASEAVRYLLLFALDKKQPQNRRLLARKFWKENDALPNR